MTAYKLSLQNFRCFESLALEFENGITWLEGDNASGKTSILEAIYLLTRARSFRTSKKHEVIKLEADYAIARLLLNKKTSIASKLTKSDVLFKANQQVVHKTSELSKLISVQFVGPHVHTLVTGEPLLRRAFIDWGLFHVEPRYLGSWKSYVKALKQRNAALQNRASDALLDAIDQQLVVHGLELTRLRTEYVARLREQHQKTLAELTNIVGTQVSYRTGWAKDTEFSDALNRAREVDRKRLFTSVGPHRADLYISIGASPAKKYGSNGQQKIIAISLVLSQQTFVRNEHKLLLIDDLLAELDITHSNALLSYLTTNDLSAVITSTSLPEALGERVNKRFHVEHCSVKSVVE